MPIVRRAARHLPVEWAMTSRADDADRAGGPDRDDRVEVDVMFRSPDGVTMRVPCFWAGGDEWRVRFAPPSEGTWSFESACSDATDAGLHGQRGELVVGPAPEETNPLQRHGGLRMAKDGSRLEHRDGTPFFWLGDTWWMGLCRRLDWPAGFTRAGADRADKGFTVVQIVAGLPPDQPAFDRRGENESGYCWEPEFARINPAFFARADLRIQGLVAQGLVPCILGGWGYYIRWMGVERMKRHWRNLIARYGAYPVVWCLAGETTMPWYLSSEAERASAPAEQKRAWTEVGAYVRAIDPYRHPLTTHPNGYGNARDQIEDPTLLDFDMLQGGQGGTGNYSPSAKQVVTSVAREPRMPVLQGEVCYEGNMGLARDEVQRFLFWSTMLAGAKGFTYGADGIWAFNTAKEQFGKSPFGTAWGDTVWEDALRCEGARTIGVGRRILERFPWWTLEPHQEWLDPSAGGDDHHAAFCAGIPGQLRLAYLPHPITPWGKPIWMKGLERGRRWNASYVDVLRGAVHALGEIAPDADGTWRVPMPPVMRDWLLVLEA